MECVELDDEDDLIRYFPIVKLGCLKPMIWEHSKVNVPLMMMEQCNWTDWIGFCEDDNVGI